MTDQLGVTPANKSKVFIVNTPVGSYFPNGFEAIRIICNEGINRSWPGGFGHAKLGANYGPTLEYYTEIKKKKYDQVLWLINDTVTEVGVMNFFVYWVNKQGQKELVTCPLDGTILPGVMRDSVITLCKDWGVNVSERYYTIHDLVDAIKENRLLEAFGTGTAAIVCPVRELSYQGKDYALIKEGNKKIGELGQKLYDYLLDIQTGVLDHPWARVLH